MNRRVGQRFKTHSQEDPNSLKQTLSIVDRSSTRNKLDLLEGKSTRRFNLNFVPYLLQFRENYCSRCIYFCTALDSYILSEHSTLLQGSACGKTA